MKGKKGKKMKKLKRIFSALLALAMVFSLSVPAFAEGEKHKIYIENPKDPTKTDTHTYEVYQIFTGRYNKSGDGFLNLSDICWGQNGKVEDAKKGTSVEISVINALEDVAKGNTYTDAQKLEIIKRYVDIKNPIGRVSADEVVDGVIVKDNSLKIDDGYYLIKDIGNPDIDYDKEVVEDTFSNYIVASGGDIRISTKKNMPSVVKKVLEINDSSDKPLETEIWKDGADFDYDDEISFKLTATLPNNVSTFDSYQLEFHDTMSEGLDYIGDEHVKITLKSATKEASEDNGDKDVTSYFSIATGKDEGKTTLTITCDNVKKEGFAASDNSIIEVIYKAKLNENANIGSAGNPNTVFLKYSNNPHAGGLGKTTTDKVTVFTYKFQVVKITRSAQGNEPLPGAGFTLYKLDPKGKEIEIKNGCPEPTGADLNIFEWEGLDAGRYLLRETKVPAGYNTMPDAIFTITSVIPDPSDNPTLTELSVSKINGKDSEIDLPNGMIISTITNNPGTKLPETGGIGTTIFHVGGAILVVGAAILLVVRKKVSEEK